jgi:hypothetical protein
VRIVRRRHGSGRPSSLADAQDVQQLLDDVHQLRLTLTADLSAAASAVEANELEVARDIISGDSADVRRLGQQREPRRPIGLPQSPRRAKALLALPAIPLVGALAITGAAALGTSVGSHGHATPSSHRAAISPNTRQTPGEIRETAASTLHHLQRVVNAHSHHKGQQVVAVATHLHDQLSAIIDHSRDAKSLGEVAHLLNLEQQLLEGHHGTAATIALRDSKRLVHQLLTTTPPVAPTSLPVLTKPTHTPTTKPSTTTKSSTPKPSTPPATTPATPTNPLPTAAPTHTRSTHHHGHHHKNPAPWLGSGLFNNTL